MMTDFTKVTNINAQSVIGEDKVLSLRATIDENGMVNFGKTIRNTELYLANLETCDADCAAFEARVRELL